MSARATGLDKALLHEREANADLSKQVATLQATIERERKERETKDQTHEETMKSMANHVKGKRCSLIYVTLYELRNYVRHVFENNLFNSPDLYL